MLCASTREMTLKLCTLSAFQASKACCTARIDRCEPGGPSITPPVLLKLASWQGQV